jgi:hypothetical protein
LDVHAAKQVFLLLWIVGQDTPLLIKKLRIPHSGFVVSNGAIEGASEYSRYGKYFEGSVVDGSMGQTDTGKKGKSKMAGKYFFVSGTIDL